jgi:hypothetical protein
MSSSPARVSMTCSGAPSRRGWSARPWFPARRSHRCPRLCHSIKTPHCRPRLHCQRLPLSGRSSRLRLRAPRRTCSGRPLGRARSPNPHPRPRRRPRLRRPSPRRSRSVRPRPRRRAPLLRCSSFQPSRMRLRRLLPSYGRSSNTCHRPCRTLCSRASSKRSRPCSSAGLAAGKARRRAVTPSPHDAHRIEVDVVPLSPLSHWSAHGTVPHPSLWWLTVMR